MLTFIITYIVKSNIYVMVNLFFSIFKHYGGRTVDMYLNILFYFHMNEWLFMLKLF